MNRDGRDGLCRRSGPIRWWTLRFPDFGENVARLGKLTNEDTASWRGYLRALEARRQFFKSLGATATDHGHSRRRRPDLGESKAEWLFGKVLEGEADAEHQELFRAQMLTEMARMSVEDGLVMQIHPGSVRNHNAQFHSAIWARYGRGHSGADGLCACAEAVARSVWK